MPPTNSVMDFRTFARTVLGRQPGMMVGRDISETEHEADKKAYDYYVKKGLDQSMAQPQPPPQFMSMTNSEGRVIDLLIKPNGEPMVVEPKTLNTQQGMFTMANPTNAAPIIDPRTGDQVMGYAADPFGAGGAPAPLADGDQCADRCSYADARPLALPLPRRSDHPRQARRQTLQDRQRPTCSRRTVNGIQPSRL
jgi:hypothetical protein